MPKIPVHICCVDQPHEDGFLKVCSINELEDTSLANALFVLINVHLNWDGVSIHDHYGFEIAIRLRLVSKYKKPILFYSPNGFKFFSDKATTDFRYKIIFGRGSAFIKTPAPTSLFHETAENIRPLSEATLQDVSTMLCDLKGVVIDILRHDLKKAPDAEVAINRACKYLNSEQINDIRAYEYLEKFKIGETDFNKLKEEFLVRCELFLSTENVSKPKPVIHKFTILVLDDEKLVLNNIKNHLGTRFNIKTVQEGETAVDLLEQDFNNEIVAVVADWRLYQLGSHDKWQSIQGYEVLTIAANTGLRSLFALTSQSEFIVHLIRNQMGIHFSLFKKSDLDDTAGWSIFTDLLYEKCDEVVNTIAGIPSGSGWTKQLGKQDKVSYRQLYYRYLNSSNRFSQSVHINKESNAIWQYIRDIYLKGNDFTDIISIPTKFDLVLSSVKPDIKPVLILRRLWCALWELHPMKENLNNIELFDEVHRILYRSGIRTAESSKKTQDPSKIGITLSDLAKGKILPEEKKWVLSLNEL